MFCRSAILIGVTLPTVLGTASSVLAQSLEDVQTPDTPLVLKAQGSFFVGGGKAEQTRVELGDLGPGGHITVNQMYVRYMVPQGGDGNVPVVMVHGATLTGKSWETTPDGRMGWDEYFVRKGHPVYVPDQVGRGRSGFNQAVFNNVRAGSAPASSLPRWIRFSDEVVLCFLMATVQSSGAPQKPADPPAATAATKAQQEVIGLSKEKWRWMSERNVDALSALFHEDAVFVHMGGTMSRRQELEVITSGGIHYKHAEIQEVSVKIIGTTAILLNRIRLVAVVGGNEVTNPFVVTEVYVQQDGTWKLGSLSFTRLLGQ